MRFRVAALALLLCGGFLYAALPGEATGSCTPTGFYRDKINMTAAVINPGPTFTGTVDATTCNVGIYIDSGKVAIQEAEIFGANYFGILVNGDVNTVSVNITDSSIHDIGEVPLNGAQHGVAIYYRALGVGTAGGTISNNQIYVYQKGGIVANGAGANVAITDNTVTGEGTVAYIAQNGIQVGYGATASVMRNTVTGHAYSGLNDAASGGILVVGGPGYGGAYTIGTRIVGNILRDNDVGVFISNLDAAWYPPETATNLKVVNNVISSSGYTNQCCSYNGFIGYQAGVSDVGNNDKIITNQISGTGYDSGAHIGAFDIDVSWTTRAKVHANDHE